MLRRFTPQDADNLLELDSDPEVMKFINGGRPTRRSVIEATILPGYQLYDAGHGHWAAQEATTGTFIGWFALQPTSQPKEAELGYRLRRPHWGKGYATEGARALVHKGLETFTRITAQTMTVNKASRHVMEKAGLEFVRHFHHPWPDIIEGSEQGDVEYAITRPGVSDQPRTRP
ncbi:RimJ/RimL family protein N-acetyltransferase [Kibdelosporangium banguiense]|uniref:RimJ/RimL family protein N-acetyltransferase n=1 Tax=Kibdelosporangium banguiense TaxID=1365924 RepID=A0ABS4TGD0_9PSEU|nr:RimJ/RimL family protein N-acetyltransferase [Kibdelosporangium banguiense]